MYAGRKIIFYVNVKKASMGTDYEDRKKKKASKSNFVFWDTSEHHCDHFKEQKKDEGDDLTESFHC